MSLGDTEKKVLVDIYTQNEDSKGEDSYLMHLFLTSFMVCSVFPQALKNCSVGFSSLISLVSHIK